MINLPYDLTSLMFETVLIEPPLSTDLYGKASYGPPVAYTCRIDTANHLIRGQAAENAVAWSQIFLAQVVRIDPRSRLTMPDGTEQIIVSVNTATDEHGPYLTEILTYAKRGA